METGGCKVWGGSWDWSGGSCDEPCWGWSWYGILQFGWWATRTNSRRSFSFCSSEISASSSAFSSSSMSVSCGQVQERKETGVFWQRTKTEEGEMGGGKKKEKEAEREKTGGLATPNFSFSACGGGCIHPRRNTSLPAAGYVRWLT